MTDKKETILQEEVNRAVIEDLFHEGCLDRPGRDAALVFWNRSLHWGLWLDRLLLFLGSALVLAGIVFFFAFNWAKLTPLHKFALVEGGILVCSIAALKFGLDKIAGKICLLSAALLVGVFLAVYGQVYQTGADAYELFTGWSLLILGWVLVSQFSALWVMWLVVVNVGLTFYWNQVLFPYHDSRFYTLYIVLAAIDAAALILYELGKRKKIDWVAAQWPRRLLLAAVLLFLSIPSFDFIMEGRYSHSDIWPLLMLIVLFAVSYWYYRVQAADLACLTLCMLTACVLSLSAIARLIFTKGHGTYLILVFALIILIVFSAASFWLKKTAAAMAKAKGGQQ